MKKKFNPKINNNNWQTVQNYLTTERKLKQTIVEQLHKINLIHADDSYYQNCWFSLRNWQSRKIEGFTLSSSNKEKKFHYIQGNKTNCYFFFGENTKHLYLTESPIDAISLYQQLIPRTKQSDGIFLATCGLTDITLNLNIETIIHIALDCDLPGELFAWKIAQKYINHSIVRHIPYIGKDFNDDLLDKASPTNQWWKKNMGNQWSKLLSHPESKEFVIKQNIKKIQTLNNQKNARKRTNN